MEKSSRLRPDVIISIIVGLVGVLLYALFLSVNFAAPGGGEGRIANAFAALGAWAALWLFLLVLTAVDRIRATRASWTGRAAMLLIPIAGVASVFATDYPGDRLCTLTIAALPLVVGTYLALGALARLRAADEPLRTQAFLLLIAAALSAYPIVRFVS